MDYGIIGAMVFSTAINHYSGVLAAPLLCAQARILQAETLLIIPLRKIEHERE